MAEPAAQARYANPLTMLGASLTTISALLFLFCFFFLDVAGFHTNPYLGIVTLLLLPGVFVTGLLLIPLGLWRERRRVAATAANTFLPLPNVTNEWQRLTVDFKVYLARNVGLGFGYWYENFAVGDFATLDTNGPVGFAAATGTPRIDWLGGLMTGYGNRPYTGQSGFVRLLYRF